MDVKRPVPVAVLLVVSVLAAVSLQAARPHRVADDVVEQLFQSATASQLTIALPLAEGELSTIELEPFSLWRENAQIVVHRAGAEIRTMAPPSTRLLRGRIVGAADSAVFLSLDSAGGVQGMIAFRDRLFQVGRGIPEQRAPRVAHEEPLLVRELDTIDDVHRAARPFACATEDRRIASSRAPSYGSDPEPHWNGGSNASYGLNLAIETDTELFTALGSVAAVTTYITTLVGEASVIYERDLNTTLTIGTLHIWSGGTDPWTIDSSADISLALGELGTVWHANYAAVARSTVVMVSGKPFDAGIAWRNVLCSADFPCADGDCGDPALDGQYGGGYAFIGAQPGVFAPTVPDPTVPVNGVPYGLPNTSDYWMLLAFTHELGHNLNGPHTHCVGLSAQDKADYQVTRDFIDECFSGECFVGSMSVPSELGTIMSFCHNVIVSGFRQSRYAFWIPGEPSELIAPYFTDALEAATPDAAITLSTYLACAPGQTASVPNVAGNTYAWTITGGTITAGASSSSIVFTPTTSPAVVQVSITNTLGCSITTSKSATTDCIIPTGVVATATSSTSVDVSWTQIAGVAGYDVARCTSSSLASCNVVGSPAAEATGFSDTTASANTAYLYRVRSRDGAGNPSSYSAGDLATTVVFTDSVLTLVRVKAVHTMELRTAANAVRALAGLQPFTFTDPSLNSTIKIKSVHLTELRDALAAARSTLGMPALVYTNPTITPGVSVIKAVNMTELRAGTQ